MKTKNTYVTSHAEPSTYSTAMLMGLGVQHHGKGIVQTRQGPAPMWGERHVYGGTVPQATIDRRRAKNRVAKKSRRVNRLRAR